MSAREAARCTYPAAYRAPTRRAVAFRRERRQAAVYSLAPCLGALPSVAVTSRRLIPRPRMGRWAPLSSELDQSSRRIACRAAAWGGQARLERTAAYQLADRELGERLDKAGGIAVDRSESIRLLGGDSVPDQ